MFVVVLPGGGNIPADAEKKLAACGGAETVFSTAGAFAAKCKNGTIVPWGRGVGTCPCHGALSGYVLHPLMKVPGGLDYTCVHTDRLHVRLCCGWCLSWREDAAFRVALNMAVVVPGGGIMPPDTEQKLAACGGAETVFSTEMAFAAKCKNGTIVPWGNKDCTCPLPWCCESHVCCVVPGIFVVAAQAGGMRLCTW